MANLQVETQEKNFSLPNEAFKMVQTATITGVKEGEATKTSR